MFHKYLFLSLVLTLILGLFACGGGVAPVEEEDEVMGVTFPDENLKAAIRDALSKPPGGEITTTELSRLTALEAVYSGIINISGLQYCTNLAELILYQNQISNLSPLSSLTNLTMLYLLNNEISDISPLSSLTNLTMLYLDGNPLTETSVNVIIPQLEERGVNVSW